MQRVTNPKNADELAQYVRNKLTIPGGVCPIHDYQLEQAIAEAQDVFLEQHHDATEHAFVAIEMTQGDVDAGYVTVPDSIREVIRVLNTNASSIGDMSNAKETLSFSYGSNSMSLWGGTIAGGYGSMDAGVAGAPGNKMLMYLMDQQRAYDEAIMFSETPILFNRHTRRIVLPNKGEIRAGRWVVIECSISLFAIENSSVWNDSWFKRYATAKAREQAGVNMTKFTGGSVFGSDISLNGEGFLQKAEAEIEALEQELIDRHVAPPMMWIG